MKQLPFVRLFRTAQVAFVAGAIVLMGASGASAATTLAGETLTSPFDSLSLNFNPTCNATGSSTFPFTALGLATGPAAGRFTEQGTFTLASPTGPLTSFTANFTITDSTRTVILATGTKSLVSTTGATCTEFNGFATTAFLAVTSYSVVSPFTETGTATLNFNFGSGSQTFVEGPFAPGPTGPATKQDCMNGGFANFTDPTTGAPFKNQGQCIKFVNHKP